MENQMNGKSRIWLIIGLIVVVAVLAGVWASYTFENFGTPDFPFRPIPPPESNPADLQFYYIARTVVSTINLALLIILIETYAVLYYKTRSQFTIGLLIFAIVFLIKDIASSPFVLGAFQFRLSGLGPFAFLEPLLELLALSVLLYLSIEY